jgi:hypothetical protein
MLMEVAEILILPLIMEDLIECMNLLLLLNLALSIMEAETILDLI